ncbi:MAG: elongation factor 4, partial [Sphingobacteriaceae bacterium]
VLMLDNPSQFPAETAIASMEEPFVKITVHTPTDYIGGILKLCEDKRGVQLRMDYVTDKKVMIQYKLPLNEMVMDFYDRLKSISKGYASFDFGTSFYRCVFHGTG